MPYIDDNCELCGGNEYEKRGTRGMTYCLTCEKRGAYAEVGGVEYLENYLDYAYPND
jgi:hypothetical protein